MAHLHWIASDAPPDAFPPVEAALAEPDGLLAAGGDLAPARLLAAYRRGIFPWYEQGQPILWWSPDPRMVLTPATLHVSRSLRRHMRRSPATVRYNHAFEEVLARCAEPRAGQRGTWITPEMASAYRRLHALGWAHSVETWLEGRLVGGLYGLAIGRAFFGESMFSRESDASKMALVALAAVLEGEGFGLIDCQVSSPHLVSLGAEAIPRSAFTACLGALCADATTFGDWPPGAVPVAEYLR